MRSAYHGTSASLASIARSGLRPGFRRRREASSKYDDGRHLFFSDQEFLAAFFGKRVLRFPWPKGAKRDANLYGDKSPGQFATTESIPPRSIQVSRGGQWRPLVSAEPRIAYGRAVR